MFYLGPSINDNQHQVFTTANTTLTVNRNIKIIIKPDQTSTQEMHDVAPHVQSIAVGDRLVNNMDTHSHINQVVPPPPPPPKMEGPSHLDPGGAKK